MSGCLARQGEPGRDQAIKGQKTSAWCELCNSATPTQVSSVKYREIFRGSFAGMISLMISDCPSQTEAVFMDPIKNICTMVHCSAPFLLSQLTLWCHGPTPTVAPHNKRQHWKWYLHHTVVRGLQGSDTPQSVCTSQWNDQDIKNRSNHYQIGEDKSCMYGEMVMFPLDNAKYLAHDGRLLCIVSVLCITEDRRRTPAQPPAPDHGIGFGKEKRN